MGESVKNGTMFGKSEGREFLDVTDDCFDDVAPIKTRFSQFPCQSGCNQEYASGLQQGLNDEAASVVAQAEALVLQQPTERALDGPAVSAQAGAMRSSALVDERLALAGPAELTVPLGIIAFVGICIADARHDGEGGEK